MRIYIFSDRFAVLASPEGDPGPSPLPRVDPPAPAPEPGSRRRREREIECGACGCILAEDGSVLRRGEVHGEYLEQKEKLRDKDRKIHELETELEARHQEIRQYKEKPKDSFWGF